MSNDTMTRTGCVVGDLLGLPFPTTMAALREQGAPFLTRAFHATGALPADNRVSAITRCEEFAGGGMGRKLLLSVAYEKPSPGLHTDLFVKFVRDVGDPLRELFAPLMEPEVRFALLSRRDDFPIVVPTCYFADYHRASCSGLLITERIAYGNGAIEPCHDKCMDDRLDDPLAHYRALTRAMARLAGFHRAGRFGPAIDTQFPFDPARIDAGSRIPHTPAQLKDKLQTLQRFAEAVPQLFPQHLRDPGFLARFAEEAPLALEHELAIRAELNGNADYVALCHWNLNLDNAWFWTDPHGELQAGLLDWGAVGTMNVAQAFYGMSCAGEVGFLNRHKHDLMSLFVEEYRGSGGPAIEPSELARMFKLAVAVLGIAWILDAPSIVQAQLPDVRSLSGRHDAGLQDDFLARAQLQLLVVFLNEWQTEDIGAALREFAASHAGRA